MRKLVVTLLALIFASSCGWVSDSKNEHITTIDRCQRLRLLIDIPRPLVREDTLDATRFRERWDSISSMGTDLIEELLTFKGDTSLFTYCDDTANRLGFGDLRTSYWSVLSRSTVTVQVSALHFISALFVDDYYFSSTRELYFERDSTIIQGKVIESDPGSRLNTPEVIDSAWTCVYRWFGCVSGKTLQEIRATSKSPLEGCGIRWLGEKGCVVFPNYPNSLLERLRRKHPKGPINDSAIMDE